jgi:hypothetical protein
MMKKKLLTLNNNKFSIDLHKLTDIIQTKN